MISNLFKIIGGILAIPLLVSVKSYNDTTNENTLSELNYNTCNDNSLKSLSMADVRFIDQRLNNLTQALSAGINSDNKNIPYTLTHQFYIPLIYGAKTNNKVLTNSFDNLMKFSNVDQILNSNSLDDLNKKVFCFFVAEYLRNYGDSSENDKKLFNLLKTQTLSYWNIKSGKVWSAEKNSFAGAKERLLFIMTGKDNGNLSYYKAVTDHELFVLGSGISLAIFERNNKGKVSPELKEISDNFFLVLKHFVVFNDDGTWLFQPNIWRDHRDYKDVKGSPNGVAWDTSHFSRFPAYLNLLSDFFASDNVKASYLQKLKVGLAKQFITKVALYNKIDNIYTFNNFINGDNQRFRVGFKTIKKGYNPSQNNVHIFYGWWKLLDDPAINNMYSNMSSNFLKYEDSNDQVKKLKNFYKEVINLNLNE